ncbi:MAG: ribulose-phosphate 3-epimerase [Clostridia bacterium]|nr:ribulose-phosphate 3-epimerase [Clostridia bacterium]
MFKITRVSPSIIASNWQDKNEVIKTLKELEKSGAHMVHLDVMDGVFVKNKTFDYNYIDFIKNNTNLLLDVHLMVANPENVIDEYIKAGADILTVHYEATKDLQKVLERIKAKGILAGVAIKPKTSTMKLKDILASGLVDVVVVMGVEPGASGQAFIPGSAEKVAEVRELDKNVFISIDGGVNLKNAKILKKFGANILVSGATIFNSKNMKKTIKALKGRILFNGFNSEE